MLPPPPASPAFHIPFPLENFGAWHYLIHAVYCLFSRSCNLPPFPSANQSQVPLAEQQAPAHAPSSYTHSHHKVSRLALSNNGLSEQQDLGNQLPSAALFINGQIQSRQKMLTFNFEQAQVSSMLYRCCCLLLRIGRKTRTLMPEEQKHLTD